MRNVAIALFVLAACCLSCNGSEDPVEPLPDESGQPDVVGDAVTPDSKMPEAVSPDAGPEITPTETSSDTMLECLPGEGCFMDKCSENSECQSGWCVEHMGEGVCTVACQEECSAGWSCKPVGSGGPDIVYICVSDYSNLCKPCVINSDCKNVGGADDVCLDYGHEGQFCGGICDQQQECPWGFTCKEADTVDGVVLYQCVADAGLCPCTGKSVSLGLWTPCGTGNEFGTCEGKRICMEGGLSDCDAAAPAEEICNGADDDCDDEIDEPSLFEGKYLELCDDGNPCTADACKGESGCDYESLTEGECVDGDACTIGDHCEDGVCKGLPIACDDDNVCTDDVCDGLGGCTVEHNQAPCDDEDPCTVADQCSQGECKGFQVECDCLVDADCGLLEDGNLCNGSLFCDTEKVPYQCAVDPATMVDCLQPEGPAALCQKAECEAATGECQFVPNFEGYACNDGDACTVGDVCSGGECLPGVDLVCADNNVCTDDLCDLETGCQFTNNTSVCNDADVCTAGDHCQDGECVGAKPLDCDDANPCTDDTCDQETGCVHVANQAACDDEDECTTGDHCALGTCIADSELDCDDNNPCTQDVCLPAGGCANNIIVADCSDGDPCTVNDSCLNGLCTPGTPLNCNDDNPCTDDWCNDDGICIHAANQADCDDGNACTVDDHCQAGTCAATQAKYCSDDNVCTTDACDPGSGCVFSLNNAPCDDDNVCTTGDKCSAGQCVSAGELACDDGNLCTDDSCDPVDGCLYAPNQAPCNDGNLCTASDQCAGGWCVSGPAIDCGDQNYCTDDLCEPGVGCKNVHNTIPCDDADECTIGEKCADGICDGGQEVNCNDGNLCTDDSCDKDQGCVYDNNSDDCNDGDACTQGDKCEAGVCTGGAELKCDDENLCTDDSCDADTGCVFANNQLQCDDTIGCTTDDVCSGGSCAGTPCQAQGLYCWQDACVDHYCGDGNCNAGAGETMQNCPTDCKPVLWLESGEVEWYPVKYPHADYKQSQAVATCKAAGLRLWRDEGGPADSPDWVYDVNSSHNLGGHDIGYKVDKATQNQQETHTGNWLIFGKEWSDSIKNVTGAPNSVDVYILNKQAHADDFETTASYTVVKPQGGSVEYVKGEYSGAVNGIQYGIVLCAKRK